VKRPHAIARAPLARQRSIALCLALGAALLAGVPLAASAQDAVDELAPGASVCVLAGKLYTGRGGEVFAPGLLIVRGGKVVEAREGDASQAPADLPLLDRRHAVVAPGLVLAQLATGSGERGEETAGARYRALDELDAYGARTDLLAQGITTACLVPGRGRLVSGEAAVVKLGGAPGRTRVLRERGELTVDLGDTAHAPPRRVTIPIPSSSDTPIEPGERQRPTSRAGALAELEARLRAALGYEEGRRGPAATRPKLDLDLEAMSEALTERRLRIDARRAPDIQAAVDLAWDLGLRPTLVGLTEAGGLTAALAALDAPVIYEVPLALGRAPADQGDHPDRVASRSDTPRRLAEAGITFALAAPAGAEGDLRLLAGLAVRGGLDRGTALAAITGAAAEVLGVADRVGLLAAGRDADFVVLGGEPLATRAPVLETWIDGAPVWRAPRTDAVVVRAGTVLTVAGEALTPGEVLIQGGVIAAVGSSVSCPPGARVIDAGPDAVVTPGFVDGWSHVGLRGDRTAPAADVALHALVAREGPAGLALARAGVTTTVLAPWSLHGTGSRIAATKTAEGAPRGEDDRRRGMVVAEVAGVAFDLSSMDPLQVPGSLTDRLEQAKAYAAKWEKYEKELAGWKPGSKTEAPKDDDAKPEVKPAGDPISGTWAATISGAPLPEAVTGDLLLRLSPDGTTIAGVARLAGQGEAPITGRLDGTKVRLTLDVDTPMGAPVVEAELDREDHLRGKVKLGPFTPDFEAKRTLREAPEIKVVARRGSRDGRPTPPPVEPALEPLRAVLARKAVLALRVRSPLAAQTLLDALRPLRLRLVLVGLDAGHLAAAALRAADVPIIVRPEWVAAPPVGPGEREQAPVSVAARLAAAGLRVVAMSDAEDGGAELPARAVAGVARGLAWGDALRALTIDAARAWGLEDKVGSLAVGKDGDLVVWDGPPFEATSRVVAVVVRGRIVGGDQ
jgi:imidazolonepropionase-like amidohydrolase